MGRHGAHSGNRESGRLNEVEGDKELNWRVIQSTLSSKVAGMPLSLTPCLTKHDLWLFSGSFPYSVPEGQGGRQPAR